MSIVSLHWQSSRLSDVFGSSYSYCRGPWLETGVAHHVLRILLVPRAGLESPRPCGQRILSRSRAQICATVYMRALRISVAYRFPGVRVCRVLRRQSSKFVPNPSALRKADFQSAAAIQDRRSPVTTRTDSTILLREGLCIGSGKSCFVGPVPRVWLPARIQV